MSNDEQIKAGIDDFLKIVLAPDGQSLSDSGRILSFKFACGRVQVDVLSKGLEIPQKRQIDALIYEGLLKVDGVTDVIINMVNPDAPTEVPKQESPPQAPAAATPAKDSRATGLPEKRAVPGVKRVIAVASGKGGVGKSTISVNLAIALQQKGYKVGLLDADCYGPSIPTMLGIGDDESPKVSDHRKIQPLPKWGLSVMSIGFFVDRDNAVIWRGLMVTKALQQFFFDVEWGELDYLIIDLPPGTGDTQLTMVQNIELHGAIIVSTPQDVALADARKGMAMFRDTHVPIIGVIENMSHFDCPHCGERTDIFSHGGARRTAEEFGAQFLGEIPLVTELMETSDRGEPFMSIEADSPVRTAFLKIAEAVASKTPPHKLVPSPEAKKAEPAT